ncbi:LamB/YcsF family protein [Spirochaeta isovalerica]|uniref:UPF0271 protein n=1 Tax=Spirochaeta isovalerica TaxID=150 RepID=A0A841RAX5_9SPIO|nr:LamB/YcsF family protein [Spirochaeta isovalerica]MBB6480866.1 UPF0271 protein [Spirochaeta isovalerica]
MKINCDIGERGIAHPVDLELMNHIHIANIACGGHAGDRESVSFFSRLAGEKGMEISAHLSFPDKDNFGRKALSLDGEALIDSLEEQLELMGDVRTVKLHGALYNLSASEQDLADQLAMWFRGKEIERVLCPSRSALALACAKRGISVLEEAFAERTYTWDENTRRLVLTPRSEPEAFLSTVEEAWEQYEQMVNKGSVRAVTAQGRKDYPIEAQTICIHSDSPIALVLAQRLYRHAETTL